MSPVQNTLYNSNYFYLKFHKAWMINVESINQKQSLNKDLVTTAWRQPGLPESIGRYFTSKNPANDNKE